MERRFAKAPLSPSGPRADIDLLPLGFLGGRSGANALASIRAKPSTSGNALCLNAGVHEMEQSDTLGGREMGISVDQEREQDAPENTQKLMEPREKM